MLKVLILGSGSALPTVHSHQSAQLLYDGHHSFLIDCGEGTQVELRRNKVKMQKIGHVFISHLHGDHFFGLVGLISTMHLLGRKIPLHIYGPKGLEEIIKLQFKMAGSIISYELNFHLITGPSQLLFDDKRMSVVSLPLSHRIECYGFLFQEKPGLRKLNVDMLREHKVPVYARKGLSEGEDFVSAEGKVIPNKAMTFDPPATKSYAYCSDTAFSEALIKAIHTVDLMYHEATFLEKDRKRADKTFHSTTKDAAKVAKAVQAKQLLIGHFSNRYPLVEELVNEAREVFEETYFAEESKWYVP